jgi:hypothetical protein
MGELIVSTDTSDAAISVFQEILREEAYFSNAPAVFLSSWRDGVRLAGAHLFGDGTEEGLERAVDKWELCPRIDLINAAIDVMSSGQKVFLAALVSFYDSDDGGRLLQRVGVRGLSDLGRLDLQRRAIVAALLLNYTGW